MTKRATNDPHVMILSEPETTARQTAIVYRLPNYAQDRRSDLRAVREKIGGIDEMHRFDELLRVYANTPGHYLIEDRLDGQVAGTRVVEFKPSVEQLGDGAATAAAATQGAQPPPHALSGLANTAREFKDLATILQPPTPSESVEAIVERALTRQREEFNRTLEQMKAAQPAAPVAATIDPIKMVREIAALQKELLPPTQTAAATPDAAESFLSQFEKFTEISERINPIRERDEAERGWMDKILGTVGDLAKAAPDLIEGAKLVMPMMPGRLQTMMQGAGASDAVLPEQTQPQATQTPQQAAPTQPAAPENESEAMTLIAHVAVNEMIKGKRPGRTADLCEDQAARFPALVPMISQLCAGSPENALATLGQFVGRNDLLTFRHSRDWILDLIDELTPDDESEPEGD
jgi:hypothetical protein